MGNTNTPFTIILASYFTSFMLYSLLEVIFPIYHICNTCIHKIINNIKNKTILQLMYMCKGIISFMFVTRTQIPALVYNCKKKKKKKKKYSALMYMCKGIISFMLCTR